MSFVPSEVYSLDYMKCRRAETSCSGELPPYRITTSGRASGSSLVKLTPLAYRFLREKRYDRWPSLFILHEEEMATFKDLQLGILD